MGVGNTGAVQAFVVIRVSNDEMHVREVAEAVVNIFVRKLRCQDHDRVVLLQRTSTQRSDQVLQVIGKCRLGSHTNHDRSNPEAKLFNVMDNHVFGGLRGLLTGASSRT